MINNRHIQVPVKVNVLIDKNISKLIESLSLFPKLRTIESCQGNKKRGAWVCFEYGESWKELSNFILGYFGIGLANLVGDSAYTSIQVTESGRIQGELIVRPDMIEVVTKAIRKLARGLV